MECYIMAKSESCANVRNNAPIPPDLPYDTPLCIIDGTKVTDLVGEILYKKLSINN